MEAFKTHWRTIALSLVSLAAVLLVVVRFFVFMVVSVNDGGMRPELFDGDRVLVDRTVLDVEVGQLVVFSVDDQFYIRRVVATPGQQIGVENGVVILNGIRADIQPVEGGSPENCRLVTESLGFDSHRVCLGEGKGQSVASRPLVEGQYYVLCDHRADCAADSRDFGPVRRGAIRGRVTHAMERAGSEPSLIQRLLGLWEEL